MKLNNHFLFFAISCIFFPLIVQSQKSGELVFKETCASCHSIGKGKLVGPDLANIEKRQSEKWIKEFIKSSQTVIKSGDKYADSLFKAFNQVQMPDHPGISDVQLNEILSYIAQQSSVTAKTTASNDMLPGNSKRGQDLFVGKIRFTNDGASCNSCHNVDMKGVLSGGALGKDLTHAISRLTEVGVQGVISGLPFPQMRETYATKPVTKQETADIIAFLSKADKQAAVASGNYGYYLLVWGAAGFMIMLILITLFWMRRKNRTVNILFFIRQLTSV